MAIEKAKQAWSTAEHHLIVFSAALQKIVPSLPAAMTAVRTAAEQWATALEAMRLRAAEGALSDAELKSSLDKAFSAEAAAADQMSAARRQDWSLYCEVERWKQAIGGSSADSMCSSPPP